MDTNIISDLVRHPKGTVAQHIRQVGTHRVCTTLVQPVEDHYAQIRNHMERLGTPIGPNDLLIAAHAQLLGLTIVTANVNEFSRVPNLMVENWLRPTHHS